MIPARGPQTVFQELHCSIHFVTGVRFTYTCYRVSNFVFLFKDTFANQQITGFHCFEHTKPTSSLPCHPANHWISLLRAYQAYLQPTLPTSKSLDFIALSLPSLPRAYLANQQISGFHCFEPTKPTSSLPCQPANQWISLL